MLVFYDTAFSQIASINGPNNVDVYVPSQFTCDVTLPSGYSMVSYTWYAYLQGLQGSINGNTNVSQVIITSTLSSNTATYIWDETWAPDEHINLRCDVTIEQNSDHSQVSYIIYYYNVHLRGIPWYIGLTGIQSIQKCCTNRVEYNVIDYGDGDIFNWTIPVGWSILSGNGTSTVQLLPDYTTDGTVSCDVRISTSPSSYVKTESLAIFRPDPVVNHITSTTIPCIGSPVTFFSDNPCGTSNHHWEFPSDWSLVSQDENYVTVVVGSSGYVTVTVEFAGGCTISYTSWIAVISVLPNDPIFDNYCHPDIDPNGCQPGEKRICALNGGTILVDFDPDVSQYNCYVTAPWKLREGSQVGSSITVMAANINDVEIYLPAYNTTNVSIHTGIYSVEAVNCQGRSHLSNYNFRRELDWWCDCPQFDHCVCPPQFSDPKDKCGGYPVRLSGKENYSTIIFPNPNNGTCTLEMKDGTKEIWITSILGKVVFHKLTDENILGVDLDSEGSGLYFLNIHSGNEIFNQKIIIQK